MLALAAFAASCVSSCQTVESVPPQTEISGAACARQLDFASAKSLSPTQADGFQTEIKFSNGALCVLNTLGKSSIYAVVALPEAAKPMMVSVASKRLGSTLFSPRVELYDGTLNQTRTIERDSFQFSDASLLVQIRHRPEERFLVVLSDPATVGSTTTRIESHVVNSGAMVGAVYVPVNMGNESATQSVFTVNGTVMVRYVPIPGADRK